MYLNWFYMVLFLVFWNQIFHYLWTYLNALHTKVISKRFKNETFTIRGKTPITQLLLDQDQIPDDKQFWVFVALALSVDELGFQANDAIWTVPTSLFYAWVWEKKIATEKETAITHNP